MLSYISGMEIYIQAAQAVAQLVLIGWAVTAYKRYEISQLQQALKLANEMNKEMLASKNDDRYKLDGYKMWAIDRKVPFPPETLINEVADKLRLTSVEASAEFIRDSRSD